MNEKLQMRVIIKLGSTCDDKCMDEMVEFEIPVTVEEKQLLGQLPECKNGTTAELQMLIPTDLYKRMCEAALHHVEDFLFTHGFENGLYILDTRRWFLKDLAEGTFCKHLGNGKYSDDDSGIIYDTEDDELFELWQKYENHQYSKQGIDYLRERYLSELSDQTNIAAVNWTIQF